MLPKSLARIVIKGWVEDDQSSNSSHISSSERIMDS